MGAKIGNQNSKGQVSWSKGLTKETHLSLLRTSEKQKGRKKTKEELEKISRASKGRIPWNKGKTGIYSEETKKRIGKKSSERFKSPEYRKNQSKKGKERWQDIEFVRKQIKARRNFPNFEESQLTIFLDEQFPGQWQYTGDGKILIGKKVPDFMHQSERKIIELFGEFWHKKEEEKEKISYYKNLGYNCLIIWCKELKSEDGLKKRISEFLNVT